MGLLALAIDVEVTSFDRIGGDLIACAFVEISTDYTLGREAIFYSRPESVKYFTDSAQRVHGISYFKALTFPTRKESCEMIIDWLDAGSVSGVPLVYHGNGMFDPKWIDAHFEKEEMHLSLIHI